MFTLKSGRLPPADVKNIIFFVRPRLELMDIIAENILRLAIFFCYLLYSWEFVLSNTLWSYYEWTFFYLIVVRTKCSRLVNSTFCSCHVEVFSVSSDWKIKGFWELSLTLTSTSWISFHMMGTSSPWSLRVHSGSVVHEANSTSWHWHV